jgi:hypothetical protein
MKNRKEKKIVQEPVHSKRRRRKKKRKKNTKSSPVGWKYLHFHYKIVEFSTKKKTKRVTFDE